MPADVIRLHMAMAFGALAMQQRMVSGCWQVALWMLPRGTLPGAALPGAGSGDTPAGRRKAASC